MRSTKAGNSPSNNPVDILESLMPVCVVMYLPSLIYCWGLHGSGQES